jgi:hypothetical protein
VVARPVLAAVKGAAGVGLERVVDINGAGYGAIGLDAGFDIIRIARAAGNVNIGTIMESNVNWTKVLFFDR